MFNWFRRKEKLVALGTPRPPLLPHEAEEVREFFTYLEVVLDISKPKVNWRIYRGELGPEVKEFTNDFGTYICGLYLEIDRLKLSPNIREYLHDKLLNLKTREEALDWLEKLRAACAREIEERGYDCSQYIFEPLLE